ncbi:hypothetical protein CVT26_011782 [Gymnopilus dilepis]|uniref:Uncharacterized protein n=1 Tax=Gymnopilus dilepis TaxID=231916 RepID=A0A409WUF0_9AGAR|nr:hypothetical protein CVT26_011782 [Gymnopilus dilepis]
MKENERIGDGPYVFHHVHQGNKSSKEKKSTVSGDSTAGPPVPEDPIFADFRLLTALLAHIQENYPSPYDEPQTLSTREKQELKPLRNLATLSVAHPFRVIGIDKDHGEHINVTAVPQNVEDEPQNSTKNSRWNFVAIPNPLTDYSSTKPVEDKKMEFQYLTPPVGLQATSSFGDFMKYLHEN